MIVKGPFIDVRCISGVAITAILEDTVRRENIKELIYWNEENICKHSNRDPTDNIAHVFLPQLMKVKESMMSLKKEANLDITITWIKVRTLMNFFHLKSLLLLPSSPFEGISFMDHPMAPKSFKQITNTLALHHSQKCV